MGQLRKVWQDYKRAFEAHLSTSFGKNWTKKAFNLGLGPKFDELEKELAKAREVMQRLSHAQDLAYKGKFTGWHEMHRQAKSLEKHGAAGLRKAAKCAAKLEEYRRILDTAIRGVPNPTAAERQLFTKASGSLSVMRDVLEGLRGEAQKYEGSGRSFQKSAKEEISR